VHLVEMPFLEFEEFSDVLSTNAQWAVISVGVAPRKHRGRLRAAVPTYQKPVSCVFLKMIGVGTHALMRPLYLPKIRTSRKRRHLKLRPCPIRTGAANLSDMVKTATVGEETFTCSRLASRGDWRQRAGTERLRNSFGISRA
jgi:hypothetical protein